LAKWINPRANLYYFSENNRSYMLLKSISFAFLVYSFFFSTIPMLSGQSRGTYWQQEIEYKMDVKMDVNTNQYTGKQSIKYKNNSPDILYKVFFHLYLNSFQPGSVMDVRSLTIPDQDPRIGDRISKLKPDEIGYEHITSLTQNGTNLKYEVAGSILEVTLAKPIKQGQSAKFEMEYNAQIPVQIRRNGRDNREGIRYSMSNGIRRCASMIKMDGMQIHM
jgi:hypothetical protein